jgi:hypothetical protein
MPTPCDRNSLDHSSLLHWPAIAGAGAFCIVFIAGLTLAAVVGSQASTPVTKSPPRSVRLPPPGVVPMTAQQETPEAVPVLVEPMTPDVTPVVPEPAATSGGVEQVLVQIAASVPAVIPNPWTPAAPSEPAAVPAARRPAVACGTSVEFVSTPALAARLAQQEHKLLFVLHVSGDFEDPGFT